MSRDYTQQELEAMPYGELKRLAGELEMEGEQIKKERHIFIDEFWRRLDNRSVNSAELREGEMIAAQSGRRPILFAKVDGRTYAFDDRCPHKGFPLHKGSLEGYTLTCAYHGGKFDIRTGQCLKHPYATYPCQIFGVDVAQDGTIRCK